jgi:phytoene dehydrogenase-like protein
MASTVEFSPGFKCNIIHDSVKWIDPRVMEKLNLDAHRLLLHSPTVVRFALDSNGNHISFHRDPDETAASIKYHSDKDAKAWKNFTKTINN